MSKEGTSEQQTSILSTLLDEAFDLKESGNTAEALKRCDAIIELEPSSPKAYNLRGMLLEDEGELDDAIEWYRKAHEIDPNFEDADLNLNEAEQELQAILREQLNRDIVQGSLGFGVIIMIASLLYFYIQEVAVAYNSYAVVNNGILATMVRTAPLFATQLLSYFIFAIGIAFGLYYLASTLIPRHATKFAILGAVGFFSGAFLLSINLFFFRFFLDTISMSPFFIQSMLPGIGLGLFSGFALAKHNTIKQLLLCVVGGAGFGLISVLTYWSSWWVPTNMGFDGQGFNDGASGLFLFDVITQQLSNPSNAVNAVAHALSSGIGGVITSFLIGYILSTTTELVVSYAD